MKIAFFTETNYIGKFPNDFENCRTEIAWMIACDAMHYPIDVERLDQNFDIGIVIFPKKGKNFNITKFKQWCTKVGMMQEGPCNLWEDFDMRHQVEYFNSLQEADFILAHNQFDKNYFKGLLNSPKRIDTLTTLMVEDSIDVNKLTPVEDRKGVIIGGNMCSWYGGFPSVVVAQEFENEPISIVSMGRKHPQEETYFPNYNYIGYKVWNDWIYELSKYKYAVHLMPTFAAGTFALNCAYLGIPCIGYSRVDTQNICHPTLSVELHDIAAAKQIAKKLYKNQSYYDDCVWDCRHGYKHFSVDSFKFRITNLIQSIL